MSSGRLNPASVVRRQRELKMLELDPPHGVSAWPVGDSLSNWEAVLEGLDGTPYSKGKFKLSITLPDDYPNEPPKIRFVTPVYHPNIDDSGRICLDTLKMPPKGGWKPALNVSSVLAMIGLLLANPNPDDGLMPDITAEYIRDKELFNRKAALWVEKHALADPHEQASATAARCGSPTVATATTTTTTTTEAASETATAAVVNGLSEQNSAPATTTSTTSAERTTGSSGGSEPNGASGGASGETNGGANGGAHAGSTPPATSSTTGTATIGVAAFAKYDDDSSSSSSGSDLEGPPKTKTVESSYDDGDGSSDGSSGGAAHKAKRPLDPAERFDRANGQVKRQRHK